VVEVHLFLGFCGGSRWPEYLLCADILTCGRGSSSVHTVLPTPISGVLGTYIEMWRLVGNWRSVEMHSLADVDGQPSTLLLC
jgi:hypothetical protein